MGQIEDFKLFATIVNKGSISKAAETLNIAKSAVSRRLSLLEQRYGTRLINREPGVWKITATGDELYQRVLSVVNDVEDIEHDFVDASYNLAGPLTVSVPRDFGMAFLRPTLLNFKLKYPDIQLTVDFDDRKVDLTRENYDFSIRIAENIEDGVIVQKIGTSNHQLFASPDYLAKLGEPKCLQDLMQHNLLHYGTARRAKWTLMNRAGKFETIEFQPMLNSNNGKFLLQAAEEGLGIVYMPDFISRDALANGTLRPILAQYTIAEWGIYLIQAENRRLNRRMRLFAEDMKLACTKINGLTGDR